MLENFTLEAGWHQLESSFLYHSPGISALASSASSFTYASMTIDERVKSDASQQIPMKETLLILKHD